MSTCFMFLSQLWFSFSRYLLKNYPKHSSERDYKIFVCCCRFDRGQTLRVTGLWVRYILTWMGLSFRMSQYESGKYDVGCLLWHFHGKCYSNRKRLCEYTPDFAIKKLLLMLGDRSFVLIKLCDGLLPLSYYVFSYLVVIYMVYISLFAWDARK